VPPATLFGSDPRQARDRMVEMADVLMEIVRDKKLVVGINRREHLTVEAWMTLGALVGVHAAIVWTKPNESGDGILARAEARTLTGALVGAAEGECSRSEQRWKRAEPFAVRSMAQTRALSRALQAPLRHIAVLAGFEGAAAEEMPTDDAHPHQEAAASPPTAKIPPEIQPTEKQKTEVLALVQTLTAINPEVDWAARCREITGLSWTGTTTTMADRLIETLRAELLRADEA
jgi:hypothetical protein